MGDELGIAAQALGISEAAFDMRNIIKARVQFGKPLADLQAVQFTIADMSTKIAASRHLILNSSLKKDENKPYGKEGGAQAKLLHLEAAMWITTKSIQLCGGNGFTTEYPVERYFRDAKITEIYEGTSEVQRIVIAANERNNC